MGKKEVKFINFASAVIALSPITSAYRFGSTLLSIGDVSFVLIILVSIILSIKKEIKTNNVYFLPFFLIFFIISLLSLIIRGQRDIIDFIQMWLRILTTCYIIDFMSTYQINIIFFQKCALIGGIFTTTIIIIQYVMMNIFSMHFSAYPSFMSLYYPVDIAELNQWHSIAFAAGQWRPSSVFPEPAHYAQYVLFGLAISLFTYENVLKSKTKIFCSIFLTIGIFISRSANGIFIAVLLWGIWYFNTMLGKFNLKKFLILIFALIIAVIFLFQTDFFKSALERLETVGNTGSSTGTLRLLQGLAVYATMPLSGKIFGVGFGNISRYLIENNIQTKYSMGFGNEYMNAFSNVLVSSGFIGFIIYMILWFKLFFNCKDILSRTVFIVTTVLCCTSAMFCTCTATMYIIFIRSNKSELININNTAITKNKCNYNTNC